MNRKFWKKVILLSLCASLILKGAALHVEASETSDVIQEQADAVKVAFCPLDGFFEYDDYHRECGYGVDYLKEIEKQSGLHFRYIYVENWEDCSKMLNSGEVDLWMPVSGTKKDSSTFAYSSESILYTFRVIMTTDDREDLFYDDYDTLDTLNIAVTNSTYNNATTMSYFDGMGIAPNFVLYDTYLECKDALEKGEVDALVSNVMDFESGMKILARFNPIDNYIVMRSDDERMVKINDAMCSIKLEQPAFATDLYEQYYPERNLIPFTKEETEYINQNEVLKIGVYTDGTPMYFQDSQTGQYRGVFAELLENLAKETGLNIQIVAIEKSDDLSDALYQGKVDLVLQGNTLQERDAKNSVILSNPLLNTEIVLATKSGSALDTKKQIKVAIVKGYPEIKTALQNSGYNFQIKEFESEEDSLNALNTGEVDALAYNTFVMSYLLQNPRYETFRVVPSPTISTGFRLMGRVDLEPVVVSIINKGIQRMGQADVDNIINQYTVLERYQPAFWDIVYEYRILLIVIMIVPWVLLVAFLLYAGVKNRYSRELTAKNVELEKVSNAKSRFLSNVSHDLRTPMNGIIGMSYFGMESENLDEAKDYHKKVHEAGQYLLRLINDTLDMSKIDSEKMVLNPEPYYFDDFLDSINNMFREKVQEKGIHFTVHVQNHPDYAVLVDKLRIQQIFVNLINNAIKFTPNNGNVNFEIRVLEEDEKQARIVFVVRDDGIGMSQEFQKKMFEPFEQENAEDVRNDDGTGLGLSIVKQLVDLMDGSIVCESNPGEGTRFIILLEMEKGGSRPKQEKEQQLIDKKSLQNILSGKKILLCEDHPMNTQIAKRLMEKEGMQVEHAGNGKIAVEMMQKSQPYWYDAILMDIRMPEMDGLEATRAIRAMDRNDSKVIPIIAMTANAFSDDVQKSLEAGMNAHLSKPVEPEVLYRTLGDEIKKCHQ